MSGMFLSTGHVWIVYVNSFWITSQTQASLPASIPLTMPSTRSISATTDDSSTRLLSMLPTPSPSISLLPLIGAPLQQTQHDFYVSQIATIIWWLLETNALSGSANGGSKARRPVVVGLALKRRGKSSLENSDDEESDEMSEGDRRGFAEIMSMIAEWPGR